MIVAERHDRPVGGRVGHRSLCGHRDVTPGTVVMLVSTYAGPDLPTDARTCGAAAYIRKDDLTPRLLRDLLT